MFRRTSQRTTLALSDDETVHLQTSGPYVHEAPPPGVRTAETPETTPARLSPVKDLSETKGDRTLMQKTVNRRNASQSSEACPYGPDCLRLALRQVRTSKSFLAGTLLMIFGQRPYVYKA